MMEFDEIEQFVYMWVCAGIDVDTALFGSHYVDEAVCLLGEKDVRRIRIDWRGIVCDESPNARQASPTRMRLLGFFWKTSNDSFGYSSITPPPPLLPLMLKSGHFFQASQPINNWIGNPFKCRSRCDLGFELASAELTCFFTPCGQSAICTQHSFRKSFTSKSWMK